MKTCARCREAKPLEEFTIFRRSPDGRFSYCKVCLKLINKENKLKNGARHTENYKHKLATDPVYKEKREKKEAEWYAARVKRGGFSQETHRKASRKYYQTHKIQHVALVAARRQKFKAEITAEEWRKIMALHNGRCIYCENKATGKDHVVPIFAGGKDTIDNCVPSCPLCNKKKNRIDVDVWVTRKFANAEEILDRLSEALALQQRLLGRAA